MRPFITITIVLAVVGAVPLRAGAQVQPSPTAPTEPVRFRTEVVVTPERGETERTAVPASTVVIEGDALPALPAAHLSEIVSFVPGFNVERSQFHAGRPIVSARGFFGGGEAEYVLLLIDGVPVADVESGLIDWSVVPTSSIRRIEAFRGPGASLYGDSAVGGVIQIFTDRPDSGGEFAATAGSFATLTADGSYGRRLPTAGFHVAGAARRTGGAFEHSGGRQFVLNGTVDGRVGGFTWRWTATGDDRNRDDPGVLSREALRRDPYASDALFGFDTLDRQSLSTAFTLRHGAENWRPQARVYTTARNEDLIRTILLAPGLGDRRARDLSSLAIGGSLEGAYVFDLTRPPMVRFGVDVAREHLDTSYRSVSAAGEVGALNSEASGHRVRTGAFVSGMWKPASRVGLSGAVRWDNVDDDEFGVSAGSPRQRAWSPRAGLILQLNDAGSVSLFSQVSKAFKVPTLDQLFDPRPYPDFRGGTFTISNSRLVPQRAANVEVGLSGTGRPVSWSALAYRTSVDDEIDFDVRRFRYANIGRSRHVGVELEAAGRWWQRVQPFVAYVLTRVVDVDHDRQLKNVPRHRLSVTGRFDLPYAVSVLARYSHTWGGFLDDDNAYPIDGPSTLDLRVRRPIGRHAIFLDVMNLTEDRYEEYGFTLTDFRGQVVPYAYPGAPRAVRAGITFAY